MIREVIDVLIHGSLAHMRLFAENEARVEFPKEHPIII